MSEPILRAGWARADVTPPLGTRLRGYFRERLADGVHDPLLAKALFLTDGRERLAVVTLDVCFIDGALTDRVRQRLASRVDLPPDRLVLHATHTHLGPYLEDETERLATGAAAAVIEAIDRAAPVTVAAVRTTVAGIAFCRRFRMTDGSVKCNPGRLNPAVVAAVGTPDERLDALLLTAGERRLIVWNYALHCDTVGGCTMGGDYPYFVERDLRTALGEGVEAVFLQGCCGDVNHIDVSLADQPKGFAQAESLGRALADGLLEALPGAVPCRGGLQVAGRRLSFAVERPTADQLAAAEALRGQEGGTLTRDVVLAERTRYLSRFAGRLEVDVLAAKVAGVPLVLLPGEQFTGLGRPLKDTAPVALIAELCHDDIRYVPTAEAYAQGGYEVWHSLLPAGAGETLAGAAADLLAGLGGG